MTNPNPADQLEIYNSVLPANRPRFSLAASLVYVLIAEASAATIAITGLVMIRKATGLALIPTIVTAIGVVLLGWHLRALLAGTGRRTARINPWPPIGLITSVLFGLVFGYGLFDVILGQPSGVVIAMAIAGLAGCVITQVIFNRDCAIVELGSTPTPTTQRFAVRIPQTGQQTGSQAGGESLVARGTYPLPHRGSVDDSALWDDWDQPDDTLYPKPKRAL